MQLDIQVYKDDDLWIGALPVNEQFFRGGKNQDVYGLLTRMGVTSALRKGVGGEDFFRVRPKEISLPVIPPMANKKNVPDQAWLNVGETEDAKVRARLFAENAKLRDGPTDLVSQADRQKKAKEALQFTVPIKDRGPQHLEFDHQSLDWSSRAELPVADYINRLGDGLMDGGDHDAYLMRTQYAPFAGGSLVRVSDHALFQSPALIAVVARKKKKGLKNWLSRTSVVPEQLMTPNLEILERLQYIEQCRQHPVTRGHLELLQEFFPELHLELFTDREYPALVRNLGSDFHFVYKLKLVGDVLKVPEVNGKKLVGFFTPNQLSDLLIPLRANRRTSAVWRTKELEHRVFNRSGKRAA